MIHILLSWLIIGTSGFLLKWVDDLNDRKADLSRSIPSFVNYLLAMGSGIGLGLLAGFYVEWVPLILGLLIGELLTGKINTKELFTGFFTVIFLLLFITWPNTLGIIPWSIVLLTSLGALIDEIGHEVVPLYTQNKFVNHFFEYRWIFRIWVMLLVVVQVLFLHVAIGLWIFDGMYMIGAQSFDYLFCQSDG